MKYELLLHWLWASRDKTTAYYKVQHERNIYNRFIGQCAITSLLVQELLWGKIISADVENYWFSHYWNIINWKEIDITYGQFSHTKIPFFSNKKIVNPVFLLNNKDTAYRFSLLKERFFCFLDMYKKIESFTKNCKKCSLDDYFVHWTTYLWKNCSLLVVWEAPARNGWRVTGRAWINSKSHVIPSWTILQKLLNILDINLFDVTFTEAIKCFPRKRGDIKTMLYSCNNILLSQIALLKPNLIITLGDVPTRSLLGKDYKNFSDVVGSEYNIKIEWKEFVLIPTYHPSPISPLSYKGNIPIYEKIREKYQNLMVF